VVTNIGDAVWFPRGGAFGSDGAVRFVVRWATSLGEVEQDRLDLPAMVPPGGSVTLPFDLSAESGAITDLQVEGVHEGVKWFSDAGGVVHQLISDGVVVGGQAE